MVKKVKKTLYIPEWVVKLLDVEGDRYDGPGVAISTMIYHFSNISMTEKVLAVESFRKKEIEMAYSEWAAIEDENAAASDSTKY
jgi:hypothetical protein